ncbi:MAG: hypothetical protein DMD97_24975 [Candidatus Rokuibacteriota bacterium]|nr:MAG: hypothetical protein DMD97_24975 [Candidatus Rokubacteria bacterium]
MTAGLEFSTFSLIGRCERTGMFPLVAYYNLRPRDPTCHRPPSGAPLSGGGSRAQFIAAPRPAGPRPRDGVRRALQVFSSATCSAYAAR